MRIENAKATTLFSDVYSLKADVSFLLEPFKSI
jgi:hypothetical protein